MKRNHLFHTCAALALSLVMLLGLTIPAAAAEKAEPVSRVFAKVDAGTLIGYKEGKVYNFRGIPYAQAERFQNPVPITSYEKTYGSDTYAALTYGEVSPQSRTLSATGDVNPYEFFTPSNGTADMVGNENCQFLNVWTNNMTGKKPVLVFFHGGGLTTGASSELSCYTGEEFAANYDGVFVSVNTRLNILGFLDLSAYGKEYEGSGMVGMEDGIEALKWVQKNIAKFGGDPKNVTILGQSGGGEKVSTLACMSDSAGLFDKVVYMSGMYSTASKEDGLANTQKLVDHLKLEKGKVVETLTNMPYEQLLEAADAAGWRAATHYGDGTFTAPLFDENGKMNPNAAKRTWIFGTAYSEFNGNMPNLAYGTENADDFSKLTDADAEKRIREQYGSDAAEFISEFKKAYPGRSLMESLYMSGLGGASSISRYALIRPDNGVLKRCDENGVTAYNYVSAYSQPIFGGVTMTHTGDIPYWFHTVDTAPYFIRGDEANAAKAETAMSAALFSFMQNGDPSTRSLSWKPYTVDEPVTMVFSANSRAMTGHDAQLYAIMAKNAD